MATASTSERLSRVGLWLAVAGGALGALGLVGHLLHISLLDRFVPGRPPMQPATAVMLMLAAIGVTMRLDGAAGGVRRALGTLTGLLVVLFATHLLAEYLRIPESSLAPSAGGLQGRPSPLTNVALAALGAAIVVFEVELPSGIRPGEWSCLAATLVAFVSLVGHAFGADPLYRFGDSHVIARR